MPKLIVTTREGETSEIDVSDGLTVMEAIRDNGFDELLALCGGCCSCATCHVRVTPEWLDKTGRATEAEQDLIDFESGTDDRSRLSCQVEMSDELDGLVVEVAPF